MNVKKYAMKFTQLSLYAPELVSNMRSRRRKFASGLSIDLVPESKCVILNNDINLSKLVVYIQKVEDEKKKQTEADEKQSENAKHTDQDASQQHYGKQGIHWFKNKS